MVDPLTLVETTSLLEPLANSVTSSVILSPPRDVSAPKTVCGAPSVTTSPRETVSHSPQTKDCSIVLYDIIASPSPICNRTKHQLQLRHTIKLLSSPELSKAELPMDFSPSRPLSPLPPVIDSSSSPGSSSAAPLGSTSMMNPLAQDCSSPATESVAPVDSLHPPPRELSPEELETLRNLKIEKASQGLRTACSPVPATDPTLGSCLGSGILSPPTAHPDGSSHSTSNSLSLHLLHLDRLYKLNLIAPLCERKNGVLP
ncbi:hypothetical protein AVEN_264388-1 [Araneus ventricosus]|uniref:Uncharacterized protein n=1 Tax=Araneus ventricosus TaxID=182803 RepID=A0A4Y2H8I9_ARAVE|nr:hypothetical protein AVEN_264388-1 [Araneus ventricosus]